jgi:hypothetical protein
MVSTRKHLEALRTADQRALAIKEQADEKALDLAREAQHYRDEQANKLREQIGEERGKYITAAVYDERHEELIRRITATENLLAESGGRSAGLSALLGYGIGVVGVVAAIVSQLH